MQNLRLPHFLPLYETLKLRCLSTTLADSLAEVEIETPGESAAQRYAAALRNSFAYKLRKVDVETLNDPVAEVKVQELVDPVRQTSIDKSRRTWQHTRKG